MKTLLLASQGLCIASLLFSAAWRRYPLLTALLALSLPATWAFQADSAWLNQWYVCLAGPVLAFRFLATLEVSYRQTEGFRYWSRLTGGAMLLGYFYALLLYRGTGGTDLESFKALRNYMQVWCGGFVLVIETFWLCVPGAWRSRRADWIAALFSISLVCHGAVSVHDLTGRWSVLGWGTVSGCAWGLDAVCWLGIGVIVLLPVGASKSAATLR